MIADLQDAFDEMIVESEWMDEGTKGKALNKVEKMITLLGYPDFCNDTIHVDKYYENVRSCEWDHFGNIQRIRALNQAEQFSQMGKPRNRELYKFVIPKCLLNN